MPYENWIDGSNTYSLALVCSDLYLQCLVLAFSSSMGRKETAEHKRRKETVVQPYSSIVRQKIRKGENPKNVLTSALKRALFYDRKARMKICSRHHEARNFLLHSK